MFTVFLLWFCCVCLVRGFCDALYGARKFVFCVWVLLACGVLFFVNVWGVCCVFAVVLLCVVRVFCGALFCARKFVFCVWVLLACGVLFS